MDSTVKCCSTRRRYTQRYVCIALSVWSVFIFVATISTGGNQSRNFIEKADKKAGSEGHNYAGLDIFEKWSLLSNKRNLLGDPDKSFHAAQPNKSKTKKTPKFQDAVRYFNSDSSREKIIKMLDSFMFKNDPNIPEINVERILNGDKDAILQAKLANLELKSEHFKKKRESLLPSLESLATMTQNCGQFRRERNYISIPLSKEETAFPIAYIITIHRDITSFERLLRSIYHPQNLYCIHVDLKSDDKFTKGVGDIVNCFENVFIASNLTSVRYTHYSRVQADINCMKDLVKRADEYPWRYVINLCGQDFPLKTNLEIVRSLKSLHGFNSLETVKTPEHKKRRFKLHFELPSASKNDHSLMVRTQTAKSPPPGDVEIFAGSAYYIFKRQAIEFILTDPFMQTFFKWCEDTYSPDELLWATIQRMYPQVPGSFPPHEKYDLNELNSITRIVKWGGLDKKVYPKCEGRFVRGICVYGCGDLAWLMSQKHLFANKFDPAIDFFAIYSLEYWIRNREIEQSKKYITDGYL